MCLTPISFVICLISRRHFLSVRLLHLIDHPVSPAPAGCFHLYLSDSGVRHAGILGCYKMKSGKRVDSPHLPARTTMLLVHQSRDLVSLNHWVASTVWAAALAVPDNDDNVTIDLNIYLITWYVVCEGRGDLDLKASDVTDSKPKYPAQSHQKPEMQTEKI